MPIEIPAPSQTFEVPLDDGARILMRRHGNPDGVRLLVTHGNGFAADAYYPYWRQLLAKFDVLVFDFRNHGRNVPVTPANHNYGQLANDLERVVQAVNGTLGTKNTAGIFHSMSARSAMKHSIEIGWRWDALLLFDPPDVPLKGHPLYEAMEIFENKLTEWAKGRRRGFDRLLKCDAIRDQVIGRKHDHRCVMIPRRAAYHTRSPTPRQGHSPALRSRARPPLPPGLSRPLRSARNSPAQSGHGEFRSAGTTLIPLWP